MFKKPFKVKSNTRLKGSDTKKLKLLILKQFPSLSDESLTTFIPNKEVIFSVKVIVHSGEIVLLYCIQKLPILFEIEDIMYPTVYMLWSFPELLPTFSTHPQVFTAISGGADLMLPGVVLAGEVNIKSYGKLSKGERVSVNLTNNKAPIAVGKTALSSFDMYMSAKRGKCVNILHYYGDTLSNYGSTLPVPDLGPVNFEGQCCEPSEKVDRVDEIVSNLTLDEKEVVGANLGEDEVEMSSEVTECSELIINEDVLTDELVDNFEPSSTDENPEAAEENMDQLLMYCFLKSLKSTVKKNALPLLASTFYKQHILAACPPGKHIDIKKTKYKKLSNFLSEVAETKIISLEMVSKGVQRISSITYDHNLLKEFDEKYLSLELLVRSSTDKQSVLANKPVAPEIKEKHTVTAAVLPLFSIYLNKKGDSLSMENIRKYIGDYVRVQNLKDDADKKYVKLDKLLKDIVGVEKEKLTWEVLINVIVNKMGHAYELSAGESKTVAVKGKLQPIDIQIGSRVGNKKVTLVSNLELYGINVTEFAQECQHGVGASTTINNVPGAKSAQVQIQGNQVIFVNKILTEKYNIQKRFIRGLENAPKRKK